MVEKKIREPIVSVLGHVDHGKTTLLDWIRGSVIASREAGGITQHIGATDVPYGVIEEICGNLLKRFKIKTDIKGLLFIDTPGHEAFTNLRKRGGSVADIAVVVIDINEGLMPQTIESIEILRHYRVPFVIAANKIDRIRGWKTGLDINEQIEHVRNELNKRLYLMIEQLSNMGFNANLFSDIHDFTKQIAIVPISAKKGDGIPELLMIIIGLTQQYLKGKLIIKPDSPAKGTILEVKEEKGLGTTIDVIIYDGVLRRGDNIVVGGKEPVITKIKAILRPKPLDEMRDPRDKFLDVDEVIAASGVKIVAPNLENAIAGTPVYVGGNELIGMVRKEIEDVEIKSNKCGVIIKADTIGSLEALISILSKENIPIKRGTIGKVSNMDVMEAIAVKKENRYLGVILSFNSLVLKDARILANDNNIKIFESNVIYKLLEDYQDWIRTEREMERMERIKRVTTPAKIRIIPKYVFRQSKPAIVGVEIIGGKISRGYKLMRRDGKVIGVVKDIQMENKSIPFAEKGRQVAISIDGAIIGRNINEGDIMYSFITSKEMDRLNTKELTEDEKVILEEIQKIKNERI